MRYGVDRNRSNAVTGCGGLMSETGEGVWMLEMGEGGSGGGRKAG